MITIDKGRVSELALRIHSIWRSYYLAGDLLEAARWRAHYHRLVDNWRMFGIG